MSGQALAVSALAATALLAAAGSAACATWVKVGTNAYGSIYELDHDSFSRQGDQVTVSLRVHYGPGAPKSANGTDNYQATRRVYCSEGAFQDLHTDYYRASQLVSVEEADQKRVPASGSIAEEVVKVSCGR